MSEIGSKRLKEPEHVRVYKRVRDMILFGELTPGGAVTIQGLTEVLGAGMTPVREAIRRLTTEGALVFQGNRRVCVPELALDQLEELSYARLALEPKLAYWATEKITPSQLCELEILDNAIDATIRHGNVREYLIQNHNFHMAIYKMANKNELLPIVERLWLRIGPSMRIVVGCLGTSNLPDMHQMVLEGLRNNQPDVVEEAMRQDMMQGIDSIKSSMK